MHYRCITKTTIQQVPRGDFHDRKKTLEFNFVHSFECEDSWTELTNTAKITLPKNVYVIDENNKAVSLADRNVNIGGFAAGDPLFLRGDIVTIEAGYRYFDQGGAEKTEVSTLFQGYISKVHSKIPIEIDCEDNMWKLKQIPAPSKAWPKSYSIEQILKELLQGTPFTVNVLSSTHIDFSDRVFVTDSKETVCQVLAKLKKEYLLKSYFRGNELRCGSLIYIESEAKTFPFTFQQDIIQDELEYQRKDDITLSAVVRNTISEETGHTTKDGQAKTKKKRIEVLVTYKNGSDTPDTFIKKDGQELPANVEGERREFICPWAKTTDALIKFGQDQLKQYYYTGLKGKFTTFGIPFVRQGDNSFLSDEKLPEHNGTYKIKSVHYSGGVDGLRQEIELDYKLPK